MREQRSATTQVVGEDLTALARRLQRLAPDYQNPERYYRHRDDLVDELVMIARRT